MANRKLTDAEEVVLWNEAARRLALLDLEQPIPMELVDRLLQQLPAQQPGESLGDRLRRASHRHAPMRQPFAVVQLDEDGDGKCLIADRQDSRRHLLRFVVGLIREKPAEFTPITEIVRLAAADASPDIELPDPERALESPDGRFRIRLTPQDGNIEIIVQALGFAADEFANQCIGFVAPATEQDQDPDAG